MIRRLALFAAFALSAAAHVGSPDIYLDGKAGPYQLFVTIRPPQVIPGVAELLVRCETSGVTLIRAAPLSLTKKSGQFSPVPDALKVSAQDSKFYTGSLWLMSDGSSQVRLLVDGDKGPGVLSIPVPSIALTTRKMQTQLGGALAFLGLLLAGGLIAIVGASVRETRLAAGAIPDALTTRRGRIAMAIAFVVVVAVLWSGKSWWDSEAAIYRDRVYKPIGMAASLSSSGPAILNLDLTEPGWMKAERPGTLRRILFVRKIDDLVPDHDHLMHLYVIRQPGLDVIYHLHPELVNPSRFRLALPAIPAGNYKLYADVVHENGLPETLTAALDLPEGIVESRARPLAGDDASALTLPVGSPTRSNIFALPDGYRMTWLHGNAPFRAGQGIPFRFRLSTADGKAPDDMAFYMGMLGHAAFVKTDGTVFAHIHPNGTVPMAALALAQPEENAMEEMPGMNHALPNEVSFPYGFPTAGRYRIFVQMRHGATVETGVFDAVAE